MYVKYAKHSLNMYVHWYVQMCILTCIIYMCVCKIIYVLTNYGKEQCSDADIACTVGVLENPILVLSVLSILRR